ncbi:MAG: efflux RND transporter periplasmic adaptor subunit [Alphaproteobacteria bacterium]|nr:efflux RND transporter periplasmic adaptor subunit [Alphaproteobacteria bacterium]
MQVTSLFNAMALALMLVASAWAAAPARAAEMTVSLEEKVELKAVFGRVESRDTALARARIGGTIVTLNVEEGSAVQSGDVVATVVDDKLALQLQAIDARILAVDAEFQNAVTELERAKKLLASGVVPKSRVDTLQTQVDVLTNQLTAAKAERAVLVQQGAEGEVLAPAPGRVLAVPVTKGSVVMPGEVVARIAGGGYFLRLSLPERHAAQITEGDAVLVGARGIGDGIAGETRKGKLVKVYPEIAGGRVLADVEVDGLGDFFVGERTLVWIPVERRQVISLPPEAVTNRYGIDYVRLAGGDGGLDVAVIIGDTYDTPQGKRTEILSGLQKGDKVLLP